MTKYLECRLMFLLYTPTATALEVLTDFFTLVPLQLTLTEIDANFVLRMLPNLCRAWFLFSSGSITQAHEVALTFFVL